MGIQLKTDLRVWTRTSSTHFLHFRSLASFFLSSSLKFYSKIPEVYQFVVEQNARAFTIKRFAAVIYTNAITITSHFQPSVIFMYKARNTIRVGKNWIRLDTAGVEKRTRTQYWVLIIKVT